MIDPMTTDGRVQETSLAVHIEKREPIVGADDHYHPQKQQHQLSTAHSFLSSMRAIIEARLINIEQRSQQIMKFMHASSTLNYSVSS